MHPEVQREKDAAFSWWQKVGTGMKLQNRYRATSHESHEIFLLQTVTLLVTNTWRVYLLIYSRSIVSKMRDNPDFGVAISAAVYESGQHQVDFSVTRHGDACCYVGFAVPSIDLDRSKCPPPIRNINFKALSLALALFLARSGSGSRPFLFRRDSMSSCKQ
jgi:hypothetical protein